MHFEKEAVRRYWDAAPCGTADVAAVDAAHRDAELEGIRYEREPFIPRFARFDSARGERLLEVGVGAGTDHLRVARAGGVCRRIDLSSVTREPPRRRLASGVLPLLRSVPVQTARARANRRWSVPAPT